MKRCPRCGEKKFLNDFGLNAASGDGRQNYCRPCRRLVNREHRARHPESVTAARVRNRPKYINKRREYIRKWRAGHPGIQSAHNAVYYALKNGNLVRPSACQECGDTGRVEGHHSDYRNKLSVRWLCAKCHVRLHHLVQPVTKAVSVSTEGLE